VVHLTGFRDVDQLYVKREDLSSDVLGGNKVRSLEFLLGHVPRVTRCSPSAVRIDARPRDRRARARMGAKTIAVGGAMTCIPLRRRSARAPQRSAPRS
jgi:hypothetical protein